MRTTTHVFWVILALLLGAADLAEAGLIAPQSLVGLQQTADLIVNAGATQIIQNGATVNFSLNVTRVIKGDPALAGTSIAAFWGSGNQGTASNISGGGIWFLQPAGGAWQVIPVVQGAIDLSGTYFPAPVNILSAYAYDQSATVSGKLASEIGSAIESSTGYSFQLYALQSGVLDQLQSPIIGVLYQRMATSSVSDNQILGLSGLIRSGSASALITAIQMESTAKGSPAAGILFLSIRDYFRATDAGSVAALGAAATNTLNPNTAFREAVGHALSAIHTSTALPFLATLLDDSDSNLRVEAVGGIGAFANGLPTQSMTGAPSLLYLQLPASAPYKTESTVANLAFGAQAVMANEAAYLSFWKGWWSLNRRSLGY